MIKKKTDIEYIKKHHLFTDIHILFAQISGYEMNMFLKTLNRIFINVL